MALSARREIHESWISRKRDRCLLALSIPSFSIPTSTIEERMRRERERDMAKAKRERGEQVGREGVDLQSGRYLQVKDSHCQHTEAQRTPHRPDNPVDRKRFVSPRRRHCLESRRGCLLRSNYVSAQESGLGSAPGNVSCLAIMRFSSEDCRADGFPLTS